MKVRSKRMTVLTAAVGAALAMSAMETMARTLTIGIDESKSNAVIVHKHFADRAARYLSDEVMQLKLGDRVRVLTFGARSDVRNLVYREVVLSRRMRAEEVARQVRMLVNSFPESAAQREQTATNLIGWLEFTGDFGCHDSGRAVILTDGAEASSVMSTQDLVSGKPLPDPDVSFEGCHVTFFGLGAGWQPNTVKTVRKAWRDWFDKAGAKFDAVIP